MTANPLRRNARSRRAIPFLLPFIEPAPSPIPPELALCPALPPLPPCCCSSLFVFSPLLSLSLFLPPPPPFSPSSLSLAVIYQCTAAVPGRSMLAVCAPVERMGKGVGVVG